MQILNQNPWTVYAWTVASLLAVYYLVAAFVYYRRHLMSHLRASTTEAAYIALDRPDPPSEQEVGHRQGLAVLPSPEVETYQPDPELAQKAENLIEHLTFSIQEAHAKRYDKEDLLLLLQLTFKDYSILVGTRFQMDVNQHIDMQCAKYGFIHLTEIDKSIAWQQVD